MRVVVQRVKKASCIVNNNLVSKIDQGLMLLVSFTNLDNLDIIKKMARKIANLRIFSDQNGKMNNSIIDENGEILSISQFTLYANPYDGNRPSFTDCMDYKMAEVLYHNFNDILNNEYHIKTLPGMFGEDMQLDVVLDGPVTINLEYKEVRK